jgi:hexosaminidase
VLLALVAALPDSARADERPATVPALREWTASGGEFALRPNARVIVARRADALRGEARVLAEDLGVLLGRSVSVARGAQPRAGDVVLAPSGDTALGAEGYGLRVADTFTIEARTPAGAFYGGRTLLQLLRGGGVPRGSGRDWPLYRERGMSLDCGRAFFPREWLEALIRRMADLKLSLLHLHMSDDQGFRIESDSHPEIVSAQHLTKDDIRVLLAYARRNHVTVVPEIDMPGHMTAALAPHPELQLTNVAGQRQPDKLDVTLPAAREFVADLLDEYLPLFPGPWWHVGADEYLGIVSTSADYNRYPQLQAYAQERYGPQATGADAVQDFVNWVGDRAAAAGKQIRVWSDGISDGVVPLRAGAVVEWWENKNSADPAELIAAGHPVLNMGWWPLYYVTGGPFSGFRASEADMYEDWDAWHFEGPYTPRYFTGAPGPYSYDLAPGDPGQLGAALAVWNDDPSAPAAQPEAIASGTAPRLRIVAQKSWASPLLTPSYAEFQALTAQAVP